MLLVSLVALWDSGGIGRHGFWAGPRRKQLSFSLPLLQCHEPPALSLYIYIHTWNYLGLLAPGEHSTQLFPATLLRFRCLCVKTGLRKLILDTVGLHSVMS